ncbi:hypothetical protein BKA93DRAFT_754673 [Sparassis latifolia]
MAVPGEMNATSGSQVAHLSRSFAQIAAEADSSMDDDEGDSFAVSRHHALLQERIVRLQRELNLTEDMHIANLNASSTMFQMSVLLRWADCAPYHQGMLLPAIGPSPKDLSESFTAWKYRSASKGPIAKGQRVGHR